MSDEFKKARDEAAEAQWLSPDFETEGVVGSDFFRIFEIAADWGAFYSPVVRALMLALVNIQAEPHGPTCAMIAEKAMTEFYKEAGK